MKRLFILVSFFIVMLCGTALADVTQNEDGSYHYKGTLNVFGFSTEMEQNDDKFYIFQFCHFYGDYDFTISSPLVFYKSDTEYAYMYMDGNNIVDGKSIDLQGTRPFSFKIYSAGYAGYKNDFYCENISGGASSSILISPYVNLDFSFLQEPAYFKFNKSEVIEYINNKFNCEVAKYSITSLKDFLVFDSYEHAVSYLQTGAVDGLINKESPYDNSLPSPNNVILTKNEDSSFRLSFDIPGFELYENLVGTAAYEFRYTINGTEYKIPSTRINDGTFPLVASGNVLDHIAQNLDYSDCNLFNSLTNFPYFTRLSEP